MPDTCRTTANRAPDGTAPESADAGAANADHLRIARALVGTSAAQPASYVGSVPEAEPARVATRPTPTLEELSVVLRVAVRRFHRRDPLKASPATSNENPGLEDLVRTYLARQSEWESREAHTVAAAMSLKAHRGRTARPAEAGAVASRASGSARDRRALLVDDAPEI